MVIHIRHPIGKYLLWVSSSGLTHNQAQSLLTMPQNQKRNAEIANVFEAETIQGLEKEAIQELTNLPGVRLHHVRSKDGIRFFFYNDPRQLLYLKMVTAVYSVIEFDVPRPKALLGHQHFTRLQNQIEQVLNLHDGNNFETVNIGAAGAMSSVMLRIKTEIASATNLEIDHEGGDLYIRLRPAVERSRAWEALIRLTPRPLVTRSWRVANMPGALNAAVAHAMVRKTKPAPEDHFLNIGCGSGTLLIERAATGPVTILIGIDNLGTALDDARVNISASLQRNAIRLIQADARTLPFPDCTFNALVADLPFGQLIGNPVENEALYPLLLKEAARIARPNAHFVAITHAVKLMQNTLAQSPEWHLEHEQMITLRGLHPRIYTLIRTENPCNPQ